MNLSEFMRHIQERSDERINKIHYLAKKIWKDNNFTITDLQNKCYQAWDDLGSQFGTEIIPLVKIFENRSPTNLIFGSGSFSTGDFQASQYRKLKRIIGRNPIKLQGIVVNKSLEHGCKGSKVAKKYNLPLVELDFIDWYHENIDKDEKNPIRATRYWFNQNDMNKPDKNEIKKRFHIRQELFHKELGSMIEEEIGKNTDIVSLRGYNFQVCSCIFDHQNEYQPHYNDTHPADLSYVDEEKVNKLYAGWQSGAVKKMMEDKIHKNYRGSFIEVKNMDDIEQINELDEGVLLGIGEGVKPPKGLEMTAEQIQEAIKVIDDYFFCTWEASGLIMLFGITKKPVPVVYQTLKKKKVTLNQRAVVVGNKFKSGIAAWGQKLEKDVNEIHEFLFK